MPVLGLALGLPYAKHEAAGFSGPLDALIAQGATLLYAGSVRRLLSSWTGNAMRLQGNGTGTPIAAIPFLANGDLDLTAAAAAASAGGGTAAAGETWHDQSGRLDATQTTIANQMPFSVAVESKGGWGDGNAALSTWLELNLGTVSFPIFVQCVAHVVSGAAPRYLLGTAASTADRICATANLAMRQSWGTTMSGTASEITAGNNTLGFLANGASSQNYLNGTSIKTGDAGNTATDMSGGRIGCPSAATFNWLASAGNSLSEIIIFSGNPTGLAGWSTFVANQKSYFGIA